MADIVVPLGVALYLVASGLLKLTAVDAVAHRTYLPWVSSAAMKRAVVVGVSAAQIVCGIGVLGARSAWWSVACVSDVALLACACAIEVLGLGNGWLKCGCFGRLSFGTGVTWGTVAFDITLLVADLVVLFASAGTTMSVRPATLLYGALLGLGAVIARLVLGDVGPEGGTLHVSE